MSEDSGSSSQFTRSRLREVLEALAPFAQADMIGEPFGEGLGLEVAVEIVLRHFDNADEARDVGSLIAMDLLTASGVGPAEVDDVMGLSRTRDGSLTDAQAVAVESLAELAEDFLAQYGDDGATVWELWRTREDVAAAFLCWHAIARLRLTTAGKLDPV